MTYELPEPIGQIVGKRLIPEGINEFWGYFAEGYENLNKIDVHTADQMQQAYQAGRDAMRQECQQECSAEADEYGVAQRISKAIGELK